MRDLARWLLVLSVFAAPGAPGLAWGQAPPAAVPEDTAALYQQAREAYERQDFAGAAALLRRVIALSPDPALFWNLGRAEEKAGHFEAAIGAYERFLASGPPEVDRAEAAERLSAVKASFGKGFLAVSSDAPGAVARIDGAEPVALPLERALVGAGDHQVTVQAPGRDPATVTALVAPGELLTLDVPLRVVVAPPAESELGTWGWSTLGVGVALAVGGGALFAVGQADAAEVVDAERDALGRTTGLSRTRALDLADQAQVKSDAGVALLAVGGAAMAASVVLLILDATAPAPDLGFVPVVWPGGVAVGGRF